MEKRVLRQFGNIKKRIMPIPTQSMLKSKIKIFQAYAEYVGTMRCVFGYETWIGRYEKNEAI
jgi:hypothetical protein